MKYVFIVGEAIVIALGLSYCMALAQSTADKPPPENYNSEQLVLPEDVGIESSDPLAGMEDLIGNCNHIGRYQLAGTNKIMFKIDTSNGASWIIRWDETEGPKWNRIK